MNDRLQILRQARAGSLERAWALFEASPLAEATDDQSALTLKARLVKDRAKLAAGGERMRLFAASGAIYEQAAALAPSSYALINAASLALLAGKDEQSRRLAGDVLALLENHPEEAETPYWRGATRAEALLLTGDETGARAALRSAIQQAPQAWEDHAATIGQFELVCTELGFSADWLAMLRPPRSVHFTGIMGGDFTDERISREIADWLESEKVGFGYGALAAGADIVIGDALVARGAELHVVLPCPADEFLQASVIPVGAEWCQRFESLLDAAASVEELAGSFAISRASVRLANAVALGLARRNARILQSEALRLRIGEVTDLVEPALGEGDLRTRQIDARRVEGVSGQTLDGPDHPRWTLHRADTVPLESDDLAQLTAALCTPIEGWSVLDCAAGDDSDARAFVSDRLAALAPCAGAGQVLATREAALALLGLDGSWRVEPMGELRGRSGSFPFYALRPNGAA